MTLIDSQLNTIRITDGHESVTFNHSCPVSKTPETARKTVRSKATTKDLLETAGVPVPAGELLDLKSASNESLVEAARRIGFPIAIKPVDGSKGEGVYTNIQNEEELLRIFDHFVKTVRSNEMVLEQHFDGDDYRALVLGDEVLAFSKRTPAHVIGDGESTVTKLIEAKNDARKSNPFLRAGLIRIDFEVERTLESQGYTQESVPPVGARVQLRRIANASAGGDSEDLTECIPEDIRQAAIAAVKAVPGMLIAGVDILYRAGDENRSPSFTVIEMNYRPHIAFNMYPSLGNGPDIPLAIIDYFFPNSSRIDAPNIEKTAFDFLGARQSLLEGVAKEVTLSPLPIHGYSIPRVVTYPPKVVTPRIRRLLLETSKRRNVSGTVTVTESALRLIAAATNRQAFDRFLQDASEILDTEPLSTRVWRGRILHGFRVYGSK